MALKGELYTAGPFGEEQIESVKQHFKKLLGQDVVFDVRRNEALIGGFLAIIDGKVYDASVAYRIKEAQHLLVTNDVSGGAEITAENVKLTGSDVHVFHSSAKDIGATLKRRLHSFENRSAVYEYGIVTSIGDGVVRIEGLSHTRYGEQIAFDHDVYGMTMDLELDGVGAVLLNDQDNVHVGERVYGTSRVVEVPVGDELLGRVVNPIGMPLDGKPLNAARYRPIESPAPRIIDRQSVNEPLMTGLIAVDSIIPIGRGQRELIIGDRQTGKTTIAVDTIINQHGKHVNCVYVAIGQKLSTIAQVYETLKTTGAMDYTVIVVANASDCAAMQYLAPYAGCAIAEQFMYDGKDALVHLRRPEQTRRRLSRHVAAAAPPAGTRSLSRRRILSAQPSSRARGASERGTGRWVSHRAAHRGDDGKRYLGVYSDKRDLDYGRTDLPGTGIVSRRGVRPAVNVGLSVSRVGSAAQKKAMRKVVKKLRLTLAQYRELQIFAQFGSDIDKRDEGYPRQRRPPERDAQTSAA